MDGGRTATLDSRAEWATWGLVLFVYGAWTGLLLSFPHWHGAAWFVAMTLTLTLHSSLCHELIHGHPTRSDRFNALLGFPPITLIFPYDVFRVDHLRHHNGEIISCPGVDPESFFVCPETWERLSPMRRFIARANMTLAGRLLMGPGTSVLHLLRRASVDLVSGPWSRRAMWISHYALVVTLLVGVQALLGIPWWLYALSAYCSLSLIMLRSFYEHRPDPDPERRSVIQHGCPLTRLLFLNNNYHAVHHRHPELPWIRIPAEFRQNRTAYLRDNGQFEYPGYSRWFAFLFRPVNSPIHPFHHAES